MEQVQINAEVERITFRNEDNGWTVTKMRQGGTSGRVFTVTGAFAAINEGQTFQLFGSWMKHPSYGEQFKVERVVPIKPDTIQGILNYLSSGLIHGIGPKTAKKIVDHFGLKTLDVMDQDARRLLEVPTLGRKKVKAIVEAWEKDRTLHDVAMFLTQHKISTLYAQKIYKLYGNQSIDIVSRDPYRLASDLRGIGFLKADLIAQSLGIAPDSHERISAGILYQMQQAEDQGHTFVKFGQLQNLLLTTLRLDEDLLNPKLVYCLNGLMNAGAVMSERVPDEELGTTTIYYRTEAYVAEVNIAQFIKKLLESLLQVDEARVDDWLRRFCSVNQTQLSEQQISAVKQAVSSKVFVLTGGPGVGKTTTANTIIRLLKAMGKSVALCAPTGRAAQRLGEVSAEPAKTIHRLLEWAPQENAFNHNENNPLLAQAVIIDEASMLDVFLADCLIRAVKTNAQIVFIGDVDQLPSVGPGNVLRDLIESERVPFVKLNQIFRQAHASRIIETAHAMNRGEIAEFVEGSDCRFIEVAEPEQTIGVIKRLIETKIPQEFGLNALRDIQILTPMNRGPLGTQVLNDEIQNLLNPKTAQKEEVKRGNVNLRPGDKVIQVANNYELGVFNGDIGYVLACNVGGGKILVQFGERSVTYENEHALDLRLAYAITIHKSQGSEFPAVIIPISMQHFIMLQRNLIYTALTRAKTLAIFVGTAKALNYAVNNLQSSQRQTLLLDRIRREIL